MFKYLNSRNYEIYNQHVLSQLAKGNESFLQRMSILQTLDVHRGCVNSVVWDDAGEFILSGSDDQQLIISKPWDGKPTRKLRTSHRANIFSAKFIPYSSNNQIISCSGDGILIYTDLNQCDETYDCRFTCHVGTSYDVITVPSDPYSFLSCGEDGTVRWFDLRLKTSCLAHECKEDILLNMGRPVTAIGINPLAHFQLAVATQDSTIHIFDRRMLGTKAHDSYQSECSKATLMKLKPQALEGKQHRVTSLRYSSRGDQVLASYSSDYLYLFDTKNFKEVPLERASGEDLYHESDSEPTLKRLRLRGDWSDTGPQAVPQGEMAGQAEADVGQARPTLQSTLMQRMTDILSRMLHAPTQRGGRRQAPSAPEGDEGGRRRRNAAEEDDTDAATERMPLDSHSGDGQPSTSSSAPPSIASPSDESLTARQPRLSDPNLFTSAASANPNTGANNMEENIPLFGVEIRRDVDREEEEEEVPMSLSASPSASVTVAESTSLNPPSNEREQSGSPKSSLQNPQAETLSENILSVASQECSPVAPADGSELAASEEGEKEEEEEEKKCKTYSESSQRLPSPKSEAEDARTVDTDHSLPLRDSLSKNEASTAGAVDDVEGASRSRRASRERTSSENQEATSDSSSTIRDACSTLRAIASFYVQRNCRMAKLVDRVIQRKRAENAASRAEAEMADRFIPYVREIQQYKGHRNARTMIKEACFWGDSHVMSGSDCGRVFVWEKHTGRLVMLWEADRHVVNCLQPHPTLPILATSGIDYDVKLWAPIRSETCFDEDKAAEIAKRNEMLLAETRDTVTVPATFMIRMLATLNQLRHDRRRTRSQNTEEEEEEEEEEEDDEEED